MNEYQDQDVWFELYAHRPTRLRSEFVKDFDTRDDAEAYAKGYFKAGETYHVKRVTGLDEA